MSRKCPGSGFRIYELGIWNGEDGWGILYLDIKISLDNKGAYDDFGLRGETIQRIDENRKQTKIIFDRYPKPILLEDNTMHEKRKKDHDIEIVLN